MMSQLFFSLLFLSTIKVIKMGISDAANRVAEEAVYAKGGYPALIQYKVGRVYNAMTSCCR